jgi:hypothetical protein
MVLWVAAWCASTAAEAELVDLLDANEWQEGL